jgi:hypothetical protein
MWHGLQSNPCVHSNKNCGEEVMHIIRAGFAGLAAVALTIGAAVAQAQSAQPDNAALLKTT